MTLASPQVNRHSKSDKDAAAWMPELNECWFAFRIVQVRRKYGLTIDRREADTLEGVLSACKSKLVPMSVFLWSVCCGAVWGTWENKACSANETGLFPSGKFSAAWTGR